MNIDEIKKAMEELSKIAQRVGGALYQNKEGQSDSGASPDKSEPSKEEIPKV